MYDSPRCVRRVKEDQEGPEESRFGRVWKGLGMYVNGRSARFKSVWDVLRRPEMVMEDPGYGPGYFLHDGQYRMFWESRGGSRTVHEGLGGSGRSGRVR